MQPEARIRIEPGGTGPAIARLVREARATIGWTQAELAARCRTSQTKIWRLEQAHPGAMDLETVGRVLVALGLRTTIEVDGLHLSERREQRDPVHARLVAAVAGRLERCGWAVATEVPIGASAPRGWIDLLAHRIADASTALFEMKTEVPDAGGLQRQVSVYERAGPETAVRLDWRTRRLVTAVVCLDSASVAERLAENASLLRRAFPGDPRVLAAWLEDPARPPPEQWTLAVTDFRAYRHLGLHASRLAGRTRQPAFLGYADAARALGGASRQVRARPSATGRP